MEGVLYAWENMWCVGQCIGCSGTVYYKCLRHCYNHRHVSIRVVFVCVLRVDCSQFGSRFSGLAALREVVKQFLGLRAYRSINQAVERQACSAIRV